MLDVQGIIESHLHLHPPQSPLVPPPLQPSTSTGFFSNLKVKTRGRSNTNPTPDEAAQVQAQRELRERRSAQIKELAAAFYTLNSKYRISWECAEPLIELAGDGGSGGGTSTTSAGANTSSSKSQRDYGWCECDKFRGWGEEEEQGTRSRLQGTRRNLHRLRVAPAHFPPRRAICLQLPSTGRLSHRPVVSVMTARAPSRDVE